MQTYRCYFLDAANHIVRAEARVCADYATGLRWAKAIGFNDPAACAAVEVWCRGRLLLRRDFDLPGAATRAAPPSGA